MSKPAFFFLSLFLSIGIFAGMQTTFGRPSWYMSVQHQQTAAAPVRTVPVYQSPTPSITPTPTATPLGDPIAQPALIESEFIYNAPVLTVLFTLQNPNPAGYALANFEYTIAAYSENKFTVGQAQGQVVALMPGEMLGLVEELHIQPGESPASISIQLGAGTAYQFDPSESFAIDQAALQFYSDGATANGLLSSSFHDMVSNVLVTALIRDQESNLIGGGRSLLPYAPGEDALGVSVPVIYEGQPASLQMYAAFSPVSRRVAGDPAPVQILSEESVQAGRLGQFAFRYQNDGTQALCGLLYQVTALDSQDQVLAVSTGVIGAAAPGEESAQLANFQLRTDDAVARYHLNLFPPVAVGEVFSNPMVYGPPLSRTRDSQILVVGQATNPFEGNLRTLRLIALARNDQGDLTGGGEQYLYDVKAGQAISYYIEIPGASSEDIIQLYADAPGHTCTGVSR